MTEARKSLVAWLQAGPMMLVFALFFVLPLVFVAIVSAWDYNEYEMIPAFSLRGYTDTFEGCVADLPNLIVMRTLSKIGMAGLRVGFIVAAPAIIAEVEKVRPPYNLGSLDQRAALWILEHQGAWLREPPRSLSVPCHPAPPGPPCRGDPARYRRSRAACRPG